VFLCDVSIDAESFYCAYSSAAGRVVAERIGMEGEGLDLIKEEFVEFFSYECTV
jgi:hypothetical protein